MNSLPDWVKNPPTNLKDKVTLLTSNRHLIKSKGPRGQSLRRLWKEINDENTLLQARAREIQPLAFFKPSYEQALILNAWMYGVSFVAVYTANRIGKTTAAIINILLWVIPNNPKWLIFQPYTDEFGRKVQVFPRPNISHVRLIHRSLKRLQRNATPESPAPKHDPSLPTYDPINRPFLQSLQNQNQNLLKPAWPDHPWPGGGTIWFGAPDHDHHEKILFPLWKQYIPQPILDRYSPSQKEITLTIQSTPDPNNPNHKGILPKITVWELVGKSYESKDTKWSSGAVDIITLTEGVTPDTMKEINMRFKDPGIGSHDFTPYEPANSGAASHLAQQIYKRQFKLSPVLHVFTKFSMRMAPSHIMSPELKAARIESLEGDPESKARIDGEFYTSSALVLSNLHRDHHLLPYTKAQFDLLLQNDPKLSPAHRQPHIFRGIDPGLDHPTACVWAYLLPSNQWVVYRVLSQRALSIPERTKRIIELSGNIQSKIYYGPRTPTSTEFYEIETHPSPLSEVATATIIDYHVFKEDETTGQPYTLNYLTKGLPIIESVHIGPEDRAMEFDAKLELSPYLPSLMPPEHIKELMHHHNEKLCNHCKLPNALTDQHSSQSHSTQSSLQGMPPGAGIYFLQYGDGVLPAFLKWEDFYWERKKSGDDKGSPKDQLPTHGDDELDAASYITCSQFKWTSHFPSARMVGDSEPESDMIEWAEAHKRQPVSESGLQSLQKLVPAGAGFFGGDED